MAAFLIVQRGEDIGRRFDLDTTQLTVGRGSDNDMVLNDPMVSRYHAVVKRQGNGYLMIDLGSSNPVVINEHVCEPGEPRVLQHRDVIFIGKTVFSFQNRGVSSSSSPSVRQPAVDKTTIGIQVGTADTESPTPLPPSRQSGSLPSTPPVQEEKPAPPAPKIESSTAPALPPTPPAPPTPQASEAASSEDDRTVVAGVVRTPESSATPFMPPPPPPPPAGLRSLDDDSTRPTPGLPPMGAGAPPPPPPPFAPPRPPSAPADDNDGDMPTQIVPRRP